MSSAVRYPVEDMAVIEQIVAEPRFAKILELPKWPLPELAIVVGSYAVVLGGAWGYLAGLLPYGLVFVASAFAIYAIFTPLHDATHKAVSSDPKINDRIGDISALLLFPGFTTAIYRTLHLEHHQFTGEADRDPDDMMVHTPYPMVILVWAFIDLFWGAWYLRRAADRPLEEKRRIAIGGLVSLLWHVAWFASPWAWEFFWLWFVPQRSGVTFLAYMFAHIQHPDGVEQRDYPIEGTRMIRGGEFMYGLLLGQSQHLMHHLFPAVPYYRYRDAWRAAEPHLRDRGIAWQLVFTPLLPPVLPERSNETVTTRIAVIEDVSAEVRSFVLEPLDESPLPEFSAGGHVDVHLSDKLVRQYSLCGDPADRSCYRLGVKREAEGRGGSKRMHELAVGDELRVGPPRNHFPLSSSAERVQLVAGGIGITPLLAMARTLHSRGTDFELHVCARSESVVPFAAELASAPWAGRVRIHLDDTDTRLRAEELPTWKAGEELYICGPTPFMDWVIGLARERNWPEERVHTETFVAPRLDTSKDRAFELVLARRGETIEVRADESALDALERHKIPMPKVCTQGMCGACTTPVLEGEIEHRDTVLSVADHKAGNKATLCVSRAVGARLVVDL